MKSETKLTSAHGPSFLRWAGSKRKSLTLLTSAYLDADHSYIEPFAGSAALFFCLKPRNGTLADLNGHLVNAMRQVRDRPKELHRRLSLMPRTSRAYYRARETFNDMRPYGIRAAVLFVYLNRNCFNGLWRTNSNWRIRCSVRRNWGAWAQAGGLLSYGPNVGEVVRNAATYVDKIIKGTKPGDLPVQQPTRFELLINLRSAKALRLSIPESFLLRADKVIE